MGIFKRTPDASEERAGLAVTAPVDAALFEDSIYGRSDALQAAIRSIARPEDFGQPFGPGSGLETVAAWVQQLVPDPLEFRPIGQRAAEALIAGIQTSAVTLDSYGRALGVDNASAQRHRPKKRESLSNVRAYDESTRLLVAMSKNDINGMHRWFDDQDFALRMVAYFQLGLLRLLANGQPLQY